MSELKSKHILCPCPVCNSEAEVCKVIVSEEFFKLAFRVECSEGCISTDNVSSYDLAVNLWNTYYESLK